MFLLCKAEKRKRIEKRIVLAQWRRPGFWPVAFILKGTGPFPLLFLCFPDLLLTLFIFIYVVYLLKNEKKDEQYTRAKISIIQNSLRMLLCIDMKINILHTVLKLDFYTIFTKYICDFHG